MMESIEKLREYTQDMRKRSVTPGHNPCADAVDGYLDEIESEIAERFIELPVDADGVPIHVGDLVALNYGEPFKVGGIRDAGNQWHIFRYELNRWWSPLDLHHVKPRTVEDVLCDMIHEYACSDMTTEQTAAKYAAELRDLMEVDR